MDNGSANRAAASGGKEKDPLVPSGVVTVPSVSLVKVNVQVPRPLVLVVINASALFGSPALGELVFQSTDVVNPVAVCVMLHTRACGLPKTTNGLTVPFGTNCE